MLAPTRIDTSALDKQSHSIDLFIHRETTIVNSLLEVPKHNSQKSIEEP